MLDESKKEDLDFIVSVGMASGLLPLIISKRSYVACTAAWKKTGEPGDMPVDVGACFDTEPSAYELAKGVIRRNHGVSREECHAALDKVMDASARAAVTKYLAQRVAA